MPTKKACNPKCYCIKNAVPCPNLWNVPPEKIIYSKRAMSENGKSTSNATTQFVRLKRNYDAPSIAGKSCSSQRGHVGFSRRSSTTTIDSKATTVSASTTSCSSCNCSKHENKQNLLPANGNLAARVNKLKYTDRRTFYEHLRQASEQQGNLPNVCEEEVRTMKPIKAHKYDLDYLRALQEFRLCNRTECFG